jgi:hypothetical protein
LKGIDINLNRLVQVELVKKKMGCCLSIGRILIEFMVRLIRRRRFRSKVKKEVRNLKNIRALSVERAGNEDDYL